MASADGRRRRIADRYVLKRPIGRGGMGVVWEATDTFLDRAVAIKEIELPATLPPAEREALRRRVLREARAAARLGHQGTVTLYDVVREAGRTWIVMELIQALTLAEIVHTQGSLSPRQAAAVGKRLLDALEAAHRRGIVHRDVKPGNVMVLSDGRTKLADFGIASLRGDPEVTATGMVLGSPAYMAPEQASGEQSGPAADLWALGATMYFAVEGEPPFSKGGAIPTLTAVVHDQPRPMRRAGPLAPVIAALLVKSPEDRPTADELRVMLAAVTDGPITLTQQLTATLTRPPWRRQRRRPQDRSEPITPVLVTPSTEETFPAIPPDAKEPPAAPDDDTRSAAQVGAAQQRRETPGSGAGDTQIDVHASASERTLEQPSETPAGADATQVDVRVGEASAPTPDDPPRDEERATALPPAAADAAVGADADVERAPGEDRATAPAPVADDAPRDEDSAAVPASATRESGLAEGAGAGGSSSEDGRRRVSVPMLVTLVLAALIVVAVAVAQSERDQPSAQRGAGAQGPSTVATPRTGDPPRSVAPAPDVTRPMPAPDGWSLARDVRAGYVVAHPRGWQRVPRGGTLVDFRRPASSTYLRVDWTDEPGPSALGAWRNLEPRFASSHSGYERIRLEPAAFRSLDAAVWEYTYMVGGERVHAVNLNFINGSGEFAYALNFQASERAWAQERHTFTAIGRSFRFRA
jgi:eukaryotic-like serine/threonine-protein kinase